MFGSFLLLFASSVLSSLLTLVVVYVLFKTRWLPRLDEELRTRERELDAKLEAFGERLEQHVKKGVLDGVAAIPSTEVLRESTRSLAKTGVEIVNAGLGGFLGKRP